MKVKYQLANGETYISVKISTFLINFFQLKNDIKTKKEETGKRLSRKDKSDFSSRKRELKNLLIEIEEDNTVYFFGFLSQKVKELKDKYNSIKW